MSLRKALLKKYMNLFSRIDTVDPTWEGYTIARNATSEAERQKALLQISKIRYEESKVFTLDSYFRTSLKKILEGKDVLEVGSNHGGAALAYYELYNLRSIVGIDTTKSQVETSKLFFKSKGMRSDFDFVEGYAENLPFGCESFGAIISFDVFEHVRDLPATMNECFRVLRPHGKLLLAFPSYYHPTQHHLNPVTMAPCVHWFLSPHQIMDVFWDILDENPEYRDRKGLDRRPLEPWEKLFVINGTTSRKFRRLIAQNAWSRVQHIPLPLGWAGKVQKTRPLMRVLKYIFWLGAKVPILEEISNQRIVYILTK